MRADVAIMLDGMARAQHQAMERERVQQEVMQRHLDTAAADRERMISALHRIGAARPQVNVNMQNNEMNVDMQHNETNITFLQQIHQQTMHMAEAHMEALAQFIVQHRAD